MKPAVLTTALTGPIATKADNPALPTTPEEIAAAAKDAHEAGAAVVHVHLRDADEHPTADLKIARRTVASGSRIARGSSKRSRGWRP
jgi:3-keto-5-aminohexanoate cleavage enzyme